MEERWRLMGGGEMRNGFQERFRFLRFYNFDFVIALQMGIYTSSSPASASAP
jgi:hypothetical protein